MDYTFIQPTVTVHCMSIQTIAEKTFADDTKQGNFRKYLILKDSCYMVYIMVFNCHFTDTLKQSFC